MAATKTAKVVTYTPEQTAELVAAYKAADSVEARETVKNEFAAKFGKTLRSIVAKLTREGVYVAKEYTTKAGEKPVKKDDTADAIGAVLKLTEAETTSLAKANKTALVKIFAALANSKPLDGVDLTEAEAASLKRCNAATREKVFAALAEEQAE